LPFEFFLCKKYFVLQLTFLQSVQAVEFPGCSETLVPRSFAQTFLIKLWKFTHCSAFSLFQSRGAIGTIAPPKTYESNFIHHRFPQFGKEHSRYKAILPFTVASPQCCEVNL